MNAFHLSTKSFASRLTRKPCQQLIYIKSSIINPSYSILHFKQYRFGGHKYDADHPPPGWTIMGWLYWNMYSVIAAQFLGSLGLFMFLRRFYLQRDELFDKGIQIWKEPYLP